MKFFVASWFFPPATSSEGIVSYKLFRNSHHQYDVCCSTSRLWSYQRLLPLEAENIRTFPIETDDLAQWVDAAVEKFIQLHATENYDAIMTRSMPAESIEVAKRIKEKFPQIPWVASLADPIAKSPYDIKTWVFDNQALNKAEKEEFQMALRAGTSAWQKHENEGIRAMCRFKEIEDYAINNADALIFPISTLKSYVLDSRRRLNVLTVPHSFDSTLYPDTTNTPNNTDAASKNDCSAEEKITLSFLGHSDSVRSLEPIVRAMNYLRLNIPDAFKKLKIRFIGNITETVRTLIYNYYLYDHISIEENVDYLTSLQIMQESDWLIHVDADFKFLPETGGSVYFAGKIADYLGTDTPILGITGVGSPAFEIIRNAGGICTSQDHPIELALILADIATRKINPEISRTYRDKFDAKTVAAKYDHEIEVACHIVKENFSRTDWPVIPLSENNSAPAEKLITFCVPAYKVESYLDRCLYSLAKCTQATQLEVIVVIDGSPDSSEDIARAYAEKYPTIFQVISKENGGHGSTINAALKVATGKYFRVLDGDDWVDSKDLDTLIKNINEKQLFPDLVSTNYKQVYISDGHTVNWEKNGAQENYQIFDFATADFTHEYFTMASMMVRTSILRQANLYLQEHTFYVDVEFILLPIPYVQTVMFTPEYVYRYAVGNADQSINPENFVARYAHHDRVIRRMLKYYANHEKTMSLGQKKYFRTILTRVIESHFTLSLIWDKDRTRAFQRAANFDNFMRTTTPSLALWAGKNWKYLTYCRQHGFSPEAIKSPPPCTIDGKFINLQTAVKNVGKKIAQNKVLEKLAYNNATRYAYQKLFLRN